MKPTEKLPYIAAFLALVISLVFPAGNVGGMYLTDGTKEVSPGVYSNPEDGVCVVGLKFDGILDVNTAINNFKDCVVYTTPGIKALGQTACTGGAGNDGYKHTWSTSICVDSSNDPISRVDLDNTAAMCTSQGGTILTTGMCVAYGWQYMNAKPGETIPYRNTITPTGYKGRTSADNLGFCYMAARMTSVPGYNTANNGGCPSYHNVSATTTIGVWVAGEWIAGTDNVLYQTQSSYDAGLGWSFAGSQCIYAYGIKGYNNAIITKADGTTIAANTYLDGTNTTPNGPGAYTTMGDCLANGFFWDNWLSKPPAKLITGIATTLPSDIMKLDATTAVLNGGGKFYSSTGSVCQKCHSDQSRNFMERNRTGFLKTGHKLAGNTAPWSSIFGTATSANKWKLKGIQCEVCHATGKPTAQDVGIVVYSNTTGTNAGLPRAASGHNQTEYGSHVNGVCFHCHGTMPSSGNPAGVIRVSGGDFAKTNYLLAPISNQFLNSPHAKFTGTNSTVSINTKTNYNSSFVGYLCRTVNNIGSGSIITTVYRNGEAGTIPNLDSLTNPACTNPGDGSATSGAAGFVVREGEAAGTANGTAYVASDQGNCMTCHDVHWAMNSTDPKAEPIRRECTTCHANSATSESGAPQVSTTTFRHPSGTGTPLALINTHPFNSCEICHMPFSSSTGSPMHLWRINTNSSYSTMGATQANPTADGTYSNAAWVDLGFSCGQCHGQSGTAKHIFTKAQLATFAKQMHDPDNQYPPYSKTCSVCHIKYPAALINHPNKPSLGTPSCGTNLDCHVKAGVNPTVATACNPCHGGSAGPTKINQYPGVRAPYLTAKILTVYAAKIHKNVAVTPNTVGPGATTPIHKYTITGNKTRTLTATDSKGLKSSASKTRTVFK